MHGCGDGVIFGSDAEVGALQRAHGECGTELPSQNGNGWSGLQSFTGVFLGRGRISGRGRRAHQPAVGTCSESDPAVTFFVTQGLYITEST